MFGKLADPTFSSSRRRRRADKDPELVLLDYLLIASAWRLLLCAAEVGRTIGYTGAWDVGIAGVGMLGASSSSVETRPTHLLPFEKVTFPADTFEEKTRVTLWDIEHNLAAQVERLVGRVQRVVATSDEVLELLKPPTA